MSDFLQHGGMFLYLNLVCGAGALAAALRFAARRSPRGVAPIPALCVASLLLGLLGSGSGMIKLLSAVGAVATPADPHWALLFKGLSEVPYNALLGLGICALSALIVGAGQFRQTAAGDGTRLTAA